MRVAVLSDTHAPRYWKARPARGRRPTAARQPRGSIGLLRVEGGRLLEAAIVPVT